MFRWLDFMGIGFRLVVGGVRVRVRVRSRFWRRVRFRLWYEDR